MDDFTRDSCGVSHSTLEGLVCSHVDKPQGGR